MRLMSWLMLTVYFYANEKKYKNKKSGRKFRNYLIFSGAEDGAQTRDPQLGRLMLYQLSYFRNLKWAKMDSNHRRRKPADLQSAPFGHSGICPFALENYSLFPLSSFVSQLRCKGTNYF